MLNRRFTFVCNAQDLLLLAALAEHFRRSRGDAVRYLIHLAAQELDVDMLDSRDEDASSLK